MDRYGAAMSSLVSAVVLPVVVALATTLVVEYSAKPRLEARKSRILRSRAEVDEIVFAAQRIGLLAGSLPRPERMAVHPALLLFAEQTTRELGLAAGEARNLLARLSPRYAVRHAPHLARTAVFLGFLQSRCTWALEDLPARIGEVLSVAEDLEAFDTYFRVYLGFRDSQEPLIKRLFWRLATQDDFLRTADEVLERHGLSRPGGN